MKITKTTISVRELIDGYFDDEEEGVVAYHGLLNVRPKYQRNFIYEPEQQVAVIDTILLNFPLNTIYWVKNEDGTYELLDGQQRTISICRFADGEFAHDYHYIHNLRRNAPNLYETFMNYNLDVYICEGSKEEQLNWFKRINIAGERLTAQELRNANYAGEWLTDAKRYFSKTNCAAVSIATGYLPTGGDDAVNRQGWLQRALNWISGGGEENILNYMAKHQNDSNAKELWDYFCNVIDWVKETFPHENKVMKNVEWGELYNKYHEEVFNIEELNEEVETLMKDEDVTSKKGIYYYVFDHEEKHLNIRKFSEGDRITVYSRQKGICPICGEHFDIKKMDAHHIVPWVAGGKTSIDNLQMICRKCHKSL